ncbi:MAG: hypothetical protein RQ745_10380 [Longimicrobiales bacterium]|nr:hypothetical protein [Longimicrobiales bacterium]
MTTVRHSASSLETPDAPRKTGWQVRSSVANAVKLAVEEGAAKSQNEFVEQALIDALRELRRRRVYADYAAAAADEVFTREMDDVSTRFESTTGDGLAAGE